MKKTFLCLGILLASALASHTVAQEEGVRIVADDWQRLEVRFTTGELQIGEVTLGDETFNTLAIEGYQPPIDCYGSPSLPTFSRLIEVPLCEGFEVEVTDAEYDTLPALPHRLVPVQLPRRKSDTSAFKLFISQAYSWDRFLGQREALVEPVGVARDRNLARLQFSPVCYNPVSGQIIVCRQATVTVRYRNADEGATKEMFSLHHSPAFNSGANVMNNLYPKAVRTAAPVRYLIVANSMFRGQLDTFVQWKCRKGFMTDIVYTDDPAVGTTTTSIQNYIQSQYTNATIAKPAPTYVLLVGDVDLLPTFNAQVTSPSSDHVTDLYYMTWTSGDHLPDCHYGRFSAQNISQLTPQIEKTLMYEQYTFADPSFLDHAVMVAGVDRGNAGDYGYTHADPAMDYAITNYVNGTQGFAHVYYFKNDVSIIPSCTTNVTISSSASGNAATVRAYYNLGAGFINYSAHGGSTGWGTPNFGNSHVNEMTNNQKFGLMIGNCCLTNKFEESTCFGEALLRKGNYAGAVGYIGGSNSTYWGEDFYWAVGVRSSIGPSMSMAYNASNLGVYDRTFHTHSEAYSQWCTTQGSMVMQGNMAVESSTSSLKWYYWEIYHLMGDPSVMPYMTQANTMSIAAASAINYGTTALTVTAAPNAYVALTDTVTNTLIAAVFANASGTATLTLPSNLAVGTYLLAASAQQYRTALRTLTVIQPTGAYPVVTSISSAPLNAGDTVTLTLHYENTGNQMARNIVTYLSCSNPLLTLSANTVTLDSLAVGASVDVTTVNAYIAGSTPDNTLADITTSTLWTGGTLTASNTFRKWLYAPVLNLTFTPSNPSLMPGGTTTVTAKLRNSGHASTGTHLLTFASPTSLFTATLPSGTPFSIMSFDDTTVTLTLHADNQLTQGTTVPVSYSFGSVSGTLPVFIGPGYLETFEGGSTILSGWSSPAAYPWVIIDSQAVEGTYCMRSSPNLTHRNTSEITFTTNVTTADSVSFYYRVSSEGNYDKFFFLIDNVEQFNVSGDGIWTRATYPLTTGTHTLTFRYTKDYNVSEGSDCAWIDNIVLPHSSHTTNYVQREVCQGDPLTVAGTTIATHVPGTGAQRITGTNGTETILDYTIYPTYYETAEHADCDSYEWNGEVYTSSTHLLDTLLSVHGCDSIVGLSLTIHPSFHDTTDVITTDSSYSWQGSLYHASGVYEQAFQTRYGCDSTLVLRLTLVLHTDTTLVVCDSYVWHGVEYTSDAVLTDTLVASGGYDSIVTYYLVVNHSVFDTVTVTTQDTSYEWCGEVYTVSGVYSHVFTSAEGCDSTVTLVLTLGGSQEGIDDTDTGIDLKLFPNPTYGELRFSQQVGEVAVYDALGREVMRLHGVDKIDMGQLPQGVYSLRLTLDGTTVLRRAVRQ